MASLSNYSKAKLGDHLLGTASFTMPAQAYAAAHTADPTDAGSGAEVSTGGGSLYARVAVDFNAVASPGGTTNPTADVVFPTAGASWGTVTHIALWDNATAGAGNMLMHGPLTIPQSIGTGQILRMLAVDLDASFA